MKKSFYLTAIMIIFGVTFTSCEKNTDDEVSPKISNSSFKSSSHNEKTGGSTSSRVFYDNEDPDGTEGIDFGCNAQGTGCMDEIVINGLAATAVGDLEGATTNTEIITIVSNNYGALSGFVNSSYLDDVISEDLTLTIRGSATTSSAAYLIFKDGPIIEIVYPVSL